MLGNRSIRLDRESHWEKQETEGEAAERLGIDLKEGEERCHICWGAKKIDWIEKIMGKPDPMAGMSCSSSSSSSSSTASHTSKPIIIPEDNFEISDETERSMGARLREWVDSEIIDGIIQESCVTK